MHEVNYLTKPIFEMHEFPEHLASRGHEVTFLHFQEGAPKSLKRDSTTTTGRLRLGGEMQLVSLPAIWTGSVFGRALYALYSWPLLLSELRKIKPNVVVNYSVPTTGWQITLLARLLGIPIIYRALDVSHKIRPSRLSFLIKLAETLVIRNSDWVSCNNRQMLEYAVGMGAKPTRAGVERPPLNLQVFARETAKLKVRELKESLGIPPKTRVIMYMGSFFYFSGLKQVIKSVDKEDDAVLLLIGSGEQDEELRTLVSSLGLGAKVVFSGPVDYNSLPRYFAISDVGINPMEPALVSKTALPNKVLQYMAANLPVVSTDLAGLRAELPPSDSLCLVNEPSQVWSNALSLLERISSGEVIVENQRQVSRLFDLTNNLEIFESRLQQLAGEA